MPKTYTTVQGDTFDLIAFSQLGSEKLMDKVIEANPEYRETVFFEKGVSLVIPEGLEVVTSQEVPPWQK